MNADEIVMLLRNDYAPDVHVMDDMHAAADIIETQQKEIERLQTQCDINATSFFDQRGKYLKALKECDRLKAQLGSAIADLHGKCSVCTNYTGNHNEGKCRFCCYETCRDADAEANDNWEWRGVTDEEGEQNEH